MSIQQQKPVIGISVGDVNGIGTELIIKTFSDHRLLEFCTPLIFGSNKLINFYRKSTPELAFNYQNTKDFSRITPKQINIWNCWEEEIAVFYAGATDGSWRFLCRQIPDYGGGSIAGQEDPGPGNGSHP